MTFFIFVLVGVFVLILVLRKLRFRYVRKLFEKGSCIVFGSRGSGKDLLFSNVVCYRNIPYCSNMDYKEDSKKTLFRYPFNPIYLKLGGNTYNNFASDTIIPYDYPLPDGVDYYISDAGVYFPAHADSDLNKRYPEIPIFQALVRHLGDCNFHCNIQALDRLWKKVREQAETYILCRECRVSKRGVVTQKLLIYDRYQSALDKVEPLRVRKPLLGRQVKTDINLTRAKFKAQYGNIKALTIKYKNKSKYDSRRFKKIILEGSTPNSYIKIEG